MKRAILAMVILLTACFSASADGITDFNWRSVQPYPAGLDARLPQYPIISMLCSPGTSTINAKGDYATDTTVFYIKPGATEIYHLVRMIVYIEDAQGSLGDTVYGGLAAALPVGVAVCYTQNGETVNLTDTRSLIKTNSDWSAYCYDINVNDIGGSGQQPALQTNDNLAVRWTFGKSGQHIRLDGSRGDWFAIVLEDDFTGIQQNRFLVQGYRED